MAVYRRTVEHARPWAGRGRGARVQEKDGNRGRPPDTGGAGCPGAAPFSVQGVEVGKAIGADKRVTSADDCFLTEGHDLRLGRDRRRRAQQDARGQVDVRRHKVVKTDSQTIAPTGPAATEFHIAKPSGWPVGKYKVDITVDGSSAGTKEFEVKK